MRRMAAKIVQRHDSGHHARQRLGNLCVFHIRMVVFVARKEAVNFAMERFLDLGLRAAEDDQISPGRNLFQLHAVTFQPARYLR